ncbi:hypothetical protein COK03_26835 [Priestia megaterium]|uniref:hypothetical protein n=1 Tax=Priestia megaterium TaxID=1404 RepID=UPI000BF416CB|nr:hypothetical protein [Priestia megaterium]PFP32987.1 hypothetical protein COK03_26835 [Priestia megaterium]
MIGNIYLIRNDNKKVVPALCLQLEEQIITMGQIRTANEVDIFNTQTRNEMERYNRGRKGKDQIKIRKKYEINTVYIDQPHGLKSKSVVMVNKLHKIKLYQVIKHIAQVPSEIVVQCVNLIDYVQRITELKKELQTLKKKAQFAQINNEKYQDYEKRIEEIIEQIGYRNAKHRNERPFLNYREVPNRGYIKVYKGGR